MKILRHLLFLIAAIPFRSSAQQPVDAPFAEALQAKIDSCVNVHALPGISVGLLLPGDCYWRGTSGVAHRYTLQPMDTSFLFQQASVTKLFTAALVMQLVDEGLVQLDDTIGDHLPDIDHVPSGVRIRDLLRHRSGIADHLGNPGVTNAWLLSPNVLWDPGEAIAVFGQEPTGVSGVSFAYSNPNFILLGMIVEEVTGMDLASALRTRITDPLGLDATFLRPADMIEVTLVPGWSSLSVPNAYTDDMTGLLSPAFSSMVAGAGALVSTPWDVVRFTQALFTGSVVPMALVDTMCITTSLGLGANTTGYGYGTMRYAFAGVTYHGHSGDINGFTQLTIHQRSTGVTLAISINRNNAPRGPIAAALLQVITEQLAVGLSPIPDEVGSVTVFPNPTDEALYVNASGPLRYRLFDASAREVGSGSVADTQGVGIDVSVLEPGHYVCVVQRSDGAITSHPVFVE
ncbi:MAG: serine hydrolase [Flavobacteriales bacterium]